MVDKDDKSKKNNIHEKRLLRSKTDAVVSGVFGGIAQYFGVDSVVVRIIAVLMLIARPAEFIIFYIIASVIIPETDNTPPIGPKNKKDSKLFGVILIVVGVLFLFENFFAWFTWDYIWPSAIIAFGVYKVMR